MFMYVDLEFDAGVFQKTILLFIPGNIQCLVLVAFLIVITIFPENSHSD